MERRSVAAFLALVCAFVACTGGEHLQAQHSPASRTARSRVKPSPTPAPPAVHRSTTASNGTLLTDATLARATCGKSGRIVRFRIGVERGLATSPTEFGNSVRTVLCNPKSWIASGAVRFRYDPNGSLLIGLRSPDGTERRCMQLIGLSVNRTYSCGTPHEVVINSDRWFYGTSNWPGPLTEYREMVTNHETGHALGLFHETCSADGAPAPVMMQQSKGLTSSNSNTCARNSWPLEEELERLS
jgi:uncharacterized protein DUF3152